MTSTTLDDEWLGCDGRDIVDQLVSPETDCCHAEDLPECWRRMREAAGEIRALRVRVKIYSKRIDELRDTLDNLCGEDWELHE